uniref:Uncharacterized protein n=1 Tax=Rhizophora mucronata TaxID=61149 RepID=A0A2P2NZJ8_RHIMU
MPQARLRYILFCSKDNRVVRISNIVTSTNHLICNKFDPYLHFKTYYSK